MQRRQLPSLSGHGRSLRRRARHRARKHDRGTPYTDLGGDNEACPEWLIDAVESARKPHRIAETREPLIELDSQDAIHRARVTSRKPAPEAQEGAGGDHTTYTVAAAVREFGVSEALCLELMWAWNDTKAYPPWAPDELEQKVANAYQYATGAWGGASALAEFDAVELKSPYRTKSRAYSGASSAQRPVICARPFVLRDPATIPPREFIYGTHYARQFVSATLTPRRRWKIVAGLRRSAGDRKRQTPVGGAARSAWAGMGVQR